MENEKYFITNEQLAEINNLIEKLHKNTEDRDMMLRKAYKTQITELSYEQAEDCITKLKKMIEKQDKKNIESAIIENVKENVSELPKINGKAVEIPNQSNTETAVLIPNEKNDVDNTQIAKPEKGKDFKTTLINSLESESKAMLPEFNKDRFVSNCITLLSSPKSKLDISKYSSSEVLNCFIQGAKCDLEYGKEFYVLPYWNDREKKSHLEIMFDYKGLIKMMNRYAEKKIKRILTYCVYKGDEFEVDVFNCPPIKHKLKFENKSDDAITHAYAYIEFDDGGYDFEVLTREEIEKVKSISKSRDKSGKIIGPWAEWYGEMARKTAVRKLSKRITLNFSNGDVNQIWNKEQEVAYDLNQKPNVQENQTVIDISGEVENV